MLPTIIVLLFTLLADGAVIKDADLGEGRIFSFDDTLVSRDVVSSNFLSLVFDLIQKAIFKDPDLREDGRLFSFEDTLSRGDVGIYYLSFVVALAMTVPVFYLSPVGQGRSFGDVIRDLPYVEGKVDNGQ